MAARTLYRHVRLIPVNSSRKMPNLYIIKLIQNRYKITMLCHGIPIPVTAPPPTSTHLQSPHGLWAAQTRIYAVLCYRIPIRTTIAKLTAIPAAIS